MPETGDGDVAPTEIDAVLENLPAFSDSAESSSRPRNRLFGRERPVHHLLGGGRAADVLLWRKKHVSGGILVGSTVLWVLFVWMGCYLLSTLSTAMLAILFFLSAWSNAAAFLHRLFRICFLSLLLYCFWVVVFRSHPLRYSPF
eukprot:c19275_g1_i2 orf=271-702(+)